MRTYLVTIARTRTIHESVEMTVKAANPSQAVGLALEQSEKIKTKDWEVSDEEYGEIETNVRLRSIT